MKNISRLIEAEAYKLGFKLFGITQLIQPIHFDLYEKWISDTSCGEINYLASTRSLVFRKNPGRLLPNSKSIIIVGSLYQPVIYDTNDHNSVINGKIASFAQGQDYHQKMLDNLKRLFLFIQKSIHESINAKLFCDTGPILEKEFGYMAGLGWIGKNGILISPIIGSFFNLGEIILDFDLIPTTHVPQDQCGNCHTCIDNCPTKCIQTDRTLQAYRCISYLTIEHKGIIERSLRPLMGNWIYGCDICQLVCPWNQKYINRRYETKDIQGVNLLEEIFISKGDFNLKYKNSAIRHMKWNNFRRNIIIALGNFRESASIKTLREILLFDPDPKIRLYSAWALGQIGNMTARDILRHAKKQEQDVRVINEIESVLIKCN